MITTVLLVLLWISLFVYCTGACFALCNAVRYKDVASRLDAERIGYQPFQPSISLLVSCDFTTTGQSISKIRRFLDLNYIRYEVILLADSSADERAFAEVAGYFGLNPVPVAENLGGLNYIPSRAYYCSKYSLYKRLSLVDKGLFQKDELLIFTMAVARGKYALLVTSLDNELTRNSLSNLAIMKMRSTGEHISQIRGLARYDCNGTIRRNFFKMMADIRNLSRMYTGGSLDKIDYGQFVVLRDITQSKGKEEFVPKPQMLLHRPNRFKTYLEQLAPHTYYTSFRGWLVSFMEFLLAGLFWGAGIHVIVTPGVVNEDFLFMLAVLLVMLIAGTFSVFIGELFLKQNYRIRFMLRLLVVSVPETVLFCLLQPWAWLWSLGLKIYHSMRIALSARTR